MYILAYVRITIARFKFKFQYNLLGTHMYTYHKRDRNSILRTNLTEFTFTSKNYVIRDNFCHIQKVKLFNQLKD